jgi:hypothetical protein
MQDLKDKAAQLQDKLSDLHADFSQSAAKQADPPSAAQWQQQWEAQVHQVSEAQQELRSAGVGLRTHDTLASAEAAAGKLERDLHQLKQGVK